MEYKHCCVIDKNSNFKAFVLVLMDKNGDKVQFYTMAQGEKLIDAAPPLNIVKAKWVGTAWEETATPEEISAYKTERSLSPAH